MIKEIVVLSGKGGTGKTTVASSLSKMFDGVVISDADVDAADMFLMMKPEIEKKEKFKGKSIAIIDYDKCSNCGVCMSLCRFNAIKYTNEKYEINPYLCDGCNLCGVACPVGAINMQQQVVGEWYKSKTKYGDMVHAKLYPGAENSGNLVTMVKHQSKLLAKETDKNIIIIDGPPGIGCPVISSLSGASIAILVTEPTFSGIHDLKRVYKIANHFNVRVTIIINKYDINEKRTFEIEKFAKDNDIEVIGYIPFDKKIMEAQMKEQTLFDLFDDKYIVSQLANIKNSLLRLIQE